MVVRHEAPTHPTHQVDEILSPEAKQLRIQMALKWLEGIKSVPPVRMNVWHLAKEESTDFTFISAAAEALEIHRYSTADTRIPKEIVLLESDREQFLLFVYSLISQATLEGPYIDGNHISSLR